MRKYKQNNTRTHHPTEQGKEGQYPTKSPGNGARKEKGKEEQLQLHNSSHFTIVYDSKDLGCPACKRWFEFGAATSYK